MTFDGYIRQSQHHADSISPEVQHDTIQRLAAANGITLDEVVEDLDVSGGKSASARDLNRLVEKVERGESAGLVVWKVSRFSRNMLDGIETMARITRAGGRLLASDFDSAAPMGKALLGLLLGLAEEELDARREGWVQAKERAIARGATIGPVPIGYRKNGNGTLAVVPEDAARVVDAFERRAAGESFASIGRRHGFVNVSKLLANATYLGRACWGEFVKEGAHPAIVSPDLFARANGARSARQYPPGEHTRDRLLIGLARCAGCGKTLKVKTRQGQPSAYYCHNAAKQPCEARAFVNCEKLERHVVGWFVGQLATDPRMVDAVAATQALDEAQALLALERERLAGYLELAGAVDDRAAFQRGLDAHQGRVTAAQERVSEASARTARLPAGGGVLDVWADADAAERRVILGGWLDQVTVTRGASRDLAGHVRVVWADGTVADDEHDAGVAAA